ncbi:hypothetical protein HNQ93_002687 [Hymenobacter luteus]|uniref:Uncharacterized protein n=2 Tax=Hymenobacter TaxID=89966 RepID=A0A7W9WDM8_9BACT|nr:MULTISPECIES: hypothetical protein [Hymenobacter]MBB4601744.1 hypothetical protein [Hymenobacter latericoloratus]MBB6059827.1 hypothetical protein [Hymenobacter luteus]
MEKLQTLAWILIGLAVFIWRMVQKARATTTREQRERKFTRPDNSGRPRPVAPGPPATAFEELLRQMQTQNRTGPPAAEPAGQEEVTPAGRAVPKETTPAPRSLEKSSRPARSLEQAAPARSLEVPVHPARRAATLPRPTAQIQPGYQPREQNRPESSPSLSDRLRNPADVRAAFILGEILQRKF